MAEALLLPEAVALALGLALLASGARALLMAQAIVVGLGAGLDAWLRESPLLAGVAILLIALNGVLLPRRLEGAQRAAGLGWAAAGVLLVGLGVFALPQAALAGSAMRRGALALALGVVLLGALATVRPDGRAAGLLAMANGIALAALLGGDPPLALGVAVLALLPPAWTLRR